MEDVSKSVIDSLPKDLPTGTGMRTSPLRSTTARERIGGCITELEALVTDLNTLIKTLGQIRERL